MLRQGCATANGGQKGRIGGRAAIKGQIWQEIALPAGKGRAELLLRATNVLAAGFSKRVGF